MTILDRTAGAGRRSQRADGRSAGRHARPCRGAGWGGGVRWVALIGSAIILAVVLAGGVGPVRGDDTPAAQLAPVQGMSRGRAAESRAVDPAAGLGNAASGSARPSGLAWHSGVFSHDAQRTEAFAAARGRPVDVLAVFPTRDSWETLLQDWWMSPSAVPSGFAGTLAVGMPLFPSDGSMERAASGADVERWEEFGRLIASRYPDAWIRPGWEFNIPNWPWAATPENVESYKAAFRHAVTGLRRGGPKLRIVFNPNEGRGASLPDATRAYPGDDVVDVVGLDAYDWYPAYTREGWHEHRTKPQGWDFWADFARERGKRFALPEWGVMTGSDASGGDNPAYIEQVLAWMGERADLMAFEAYFEETEDYCRCALSLNPKAQAAYAAALPTAADPARLTGARAWATDPPAGAGSAEQAPAAAPTDGQSSSGSAPHPATTGPRPGDALSTAQPLTTGPQPQSAQPQSAQPSPRPSGESPPSGSGQERHDTEPAGTEPDDTKPDDTKPDDTKPDDTKPDDTEPDDTEPLDAEPPATEPPDVPGEDATHTPESVRSPGRGRYGRETPARSMGPD